MNKYISSLTPEPSWRSPFNIYSAAPLEDYTASKWAKESVQKKKKKMAGKKKIKKVRFFIGYDGQGRSTEEKR